MLVRSPGEEHLLLPLAYIYLDCSLNVPNVLLMYCYMVVALSWQGRDRTGVGQAKCLKQVEVYLEKITLCQIPSTSTRGTKSSKYICNPLSICTSVDERILPLAPVPPVMITSSSQLQIANKLILKNRVRFKENMLWPIWRLQSSGCTPNLT